MHYRYTSLNTTSTTLTRMKPTACTRFPNRYGSITLRLPDCNSCSYAHGEGLTLICRFVDQEFEWPETGFRSASNSWLKDRLHRSGVDVVARAALNYIARIFFFFFDRVLMCSSGGT